ncbi:MAG: GerMN domain-containing protein [Lachnospiraceae bacterium]|nr:GerMN domain-containing protein [Lachnospiraceae bacterium]MDD5956323.1 GerMN domain-containing protein [Lachnospiraceae bacterium]MDY3991380.1 GerMN domain-containing protein [Lachnospiraceae bacterium]
MRYFLKKTGCICLCMVLLFALVSCGDKKSADQGNDGRVKVYYLNQLRTSLYPVSEGVREQSARKKVSFLLRQLSTAKSDKDYTNPIPEAVIIRNFTLKQKQLIISFSRDYETLSKVQEALLRAAVVKTLVQLPEVDSVTFRIVNESLLDSAGNAIGAMTADSFVDDFDFEQDSTKAVYLTLYCPAADGSGLIKESREAHINENVPLAQAVMSQLSKSPDSKNADVTLPASVKVLSVNVNDGICYVDLDSSLDNAGGNVSENLRIYSIVDSLCELDQINRVQIIIGSGDDAKVVNDDNNNSTYSPNLNLVNAG